ncbi:MAG TPA: GAF domain-containing protein [Actinomycetes bacterium]
MIRELKLLLQGADELAGEGLTATLHRVADGAATLLRAHGATVMLADEDDVLRCAAACGASGRSLGTAQERLGAGPAHLSFAQDAPVACRDVTTDRRWPDLRHLIDPAAVRAVLSAPLTLPHGGPIGVLDVFAAKARDWDMAEIADTMVYAGVAASVIALALEARLRGVLLDRLLEALRSATDRPGPQDG